MDGLQPSERGKPGGRQHDICCMRGAIANAQFSLYATLPL
jgi:hypothetical protein